MPARPRVPHKAPLDVQEAIRTRMQLHAELPEPEERRAIRERAGLSQHELADAVGCTRPAVSQWEAGTRSPQGEMLDRYVAALRAMKEQ